MKKLSHVYENVLEFLQMNGPQTRYNILQAGFGMPEIRYLEKNGKVFSERTADGKKLYFAATEKSSPPGRSNGL